MPESAPVADVPFAGGIEDFESLVQQHRPRIFRFLLASLRDRETAENLTQDCFVRAFKARDQFRGNSSLGTWLMHIAANLVRDHESNSRLKFWKRRLRPGVDPNDLSDWIPDQQKSPEALALAKEQVASHMEGRVEFVGAAADGLSAPVCGRHGPSGDRRCNGNEGRDGQDAPLSGGAVGKARPGGRQMNQHLSSDQISKCLIGDGSPQETQHVWECAACSAELGRVESSFSQFRGSIRHWSDGVSVTDGAIPWNVRIEVATLQGLYAGHETIAGIGSADHSRGGGSAASGCRLAPAGPESGERVRPFVRAGSAAASAQATRTVQGRRRKPGKDGGNQGQASQGGAQVVCSADSAAGRS